jgi:two-component system, sensor histidine kinase LadS
MRADRLHVDAPRWPQTRTELDEWIRDHLAISPNDRARLMTAIDVVFTRHQRLWQESKEEAIQALSAGFTEKMARLRKELSARDATVSSIARYFEDLVDSLTERSHLDPKTKLMNFEWFMQQLESYLELEQRVRFCGVGLVDIARFKWYNDTLGHALGDDVIAQVATLLAEHIRSADVLAGEMRGHQRLDLHARFGGDEFCFLIPDLTGARDAVVIADRFRTAVEQFDWTRVDAGLALQPVKVDVGVVSLRMGPVSERRFTARRLALELVQHADQLMYDAKAEGSIRVHDIAMEVRGGELVALQ